MVYFALINMLPCFISTGKVVDIYAKFDVIVSLYTYRNLTGFLASQSFIFYFFY